MKRVWDFLNSLKLTVYLVLVMTAITMYGSIVIYANPDIFGNMDQVLFFRWLLSDGLQNLNKTWWFYLLVLVVVLFGINTLVCTIERLPVLIRRYRNPLLNMRDLELGGGRGRELKLGGSGLEGALKANGYSVFRDGDRVFAEKNRWLPFIPYAVHIGVMMFLVGHLISGIYGYRNSGLFIFEGETAKSPAGGFFLRLDKVTVETRPDGSMKNYGSRLTAIKDGKVIKAGMVTANKPMFVEGGAVYQREFGHAPKGVYVYAEVKSTGGKGYINIPKDTSSVAVPNSPYRIGVEALVQDFAVDENGRPYARSEEMINPAMLVRLEKDGAPKSVGWVIQKQPQMDSFRDDDVSIRMAEVDMRPYSSFDVNRDPSAILALIASALVMFGTFITLYVRRERVWAKLDEKGGRAQVLSTDEGLYDKFNG